VDETGYVYMRARYYDCGVGRFVSEDPAGGINPYVYVGNNPINFRDPSGLKAEVGCPEVIAFWVPIDTWGTLVPVYVEVCPLDPVEATVKRTGWVIIDMPVGGYSRGWQTGDDFSQGGGGGPGDSSQDSDLSFVGKAMATVTPDFVVPIGKCVDRYNHLAFDVSLVANFAASTLVGTKRPYLLGTEFGRTSWQHQLGSKLSEVFGKPWISRLGRALGRGAAALTLYEGVYDIGIIFQCVLGSTE
jgi:hypothetical protein